MKINSISKLLQYISEYRLQGDLIEACEEIIIVGDYELSSRLLNYFNKKNTKIILFNFHGEGDINGFTVYKWTDDCYKKYSNKAIIVAFEDEDETKTFCKYLIGKDFKNVFEGKKFIRYISSLSIINDYDTYVQMNKTCFEVDSRYISISIDNLYANAGKNFNNYYLQQDLWAAKLIYINKPNVHYDIGSRVDGFITHLLSFNQKTILIDIRPLETFNIENLSFIQEDATVFDHIVDNSIESLSALCSIEHFGLGRYGDSVDPEADIKTFKNMSRVLKKGGHLYVSVPVSNTLYLMFNARRVYTPKYIIKQFSSLRLLEFSCATPYGLKRNMDIEDMSNDIVYGLFHFQK